MKNSQKMVMTSRLFYLVILLFSTTYLTGQNTGGFANVSSGGTTVTVSSSSQLLDYISRSGSYIINISGTINLSGMNNVTSNKTIRGGTVVGGGFNISGVNNVVIQHVTFRNWNDDAVNVQSGATNVWIDHCSFSNGYDGAVDVKRGSDYITVSWNHFFNHGKTCLLGHSDSNGSQDRGHLRVTYHHNYFDGTDSRHPRVRFSALTHVYNNYFRDNEYGVASTMDAEVLVEGNYFQDCEDPTLVGYASSGPGDLVQRNNIFSGSTGSPQTRGSVSNPPYSYSLSSASSVPGSVSSNAGPGGGGDDGGGGGPSFVRFQNRGTGLYLDGMGRSGNGDACGQYANTNHVNAQWELINAGSGYNRVRNRGTGLYLDGMGRSGNGDDCGQWANTNHNNSHWAIEQYSGNYYRLRNRSTGLYLDGMGRTDNGSNVGQWSGSGHVNQQWLMVGGTSRMAFESAEELVEISSTQLYPNPIEQNAPFVIKLPAVSERVNLQIHDLSGKLISSEEYQSVDKIDVRSNLKSGAYLIRVISENDQFIHKLIVN